MMTGPLVLGLVATLPSVSHVTAASGESFRVHWSQIFGLVFAALVPLGALILMLASGLSSTSSFLVGLSGALIAHYRGIVTWERFTLETSITYLAMIIIGGLGSVSGSFYGAAFLTLLPALITTVGRQLQGTAPSLAAVLPFIQQGVFGLVVILFLVLEPEGLAKLWRNVKDYFRVWPFSY